MEDQSFLSHFTLLTQQNVPRKKKQESSQAIVNLLLAASKDSKNQNKKYSTGDLGDKVFADLNYTLKRLCRGLASENHAAKEGFFAALVFVLNRFKNLVDSEKLLKMILAQTKVNAQMKASEANPLSFGRMMALSALVEAKLLSKERVMQVTLGALLDLFTSVEFLRQAISVVLVKLIVNAPNAQNSLLKIVMEKIFPSDKEGRVEIRKHLQQSIAKFGLFLQLQDLADQGKINVNQEFKEVLGFDLLGDKSNIQIVKQMILSQAKSQGSIDSTTKILNLLSAKLASSDEKTITFVLNKVFEEGVFAKIQEDQEEKQGKGSKIKLIQFGFVFIRNLIQNLVPKKASKVLNQSCLFQQNFLKVFYKTLSSSKSTLNPLANEIKELIGKKIQESKLKPQEALKLVQKLFGPNMQEQLTLKRNQEMLQGICSHLDFQTCQDLVAHLKVQVKKPEVSAFYSERGELEEEDQELKQFNKAQNIQIFVLNLLNQVPYLCRNVLEDTNVIDEILQIHIELTLKKGEQAFRDLCFTKFTSFLLILTKVKGSNCSKGFRKQNQLWSEYACVKIAENLSDSQAVEKKCFTETIEFIKENISKSCKNLKINEGEDLSEEKQVLIKEAFKKQVCFKKLLLHLLIILLEPLKEGEVLEDKVQDIEELQVCYENCSLPQTKKEATSLKKQKKTDVSESYSVLVDLLTSLLTKQQILVREVANGLFQQICTDLNIESLENLFEIISTPDHLAQKSFIKGDEGDEGEGMEEEDGDEDEEEEEEEDSEMSD